MTIYQDQWKPVAIALPNILGMKFQALIKGCGEQVEIEVFASRLPTFTGLRELIEKGHVTGGSRKNQAFLGNDLVIEPSVEPWLVEVVLDAQTSGGLALFTPREIPGMDPIGIVRDGSARIRVAGR